MKKIIKKFWGVAFVVVLLSALFVGALPQASAGILSYSWEQLPGGLTGGVAVNLSAITANTTVIYDFAVAADGTTIYAATSLGARKSINAGRTWIPLGVPTGLISTALVAVAPDDANLVVYADRNLVANGGGNVSFSKNGGTTFTSAGRPTSTISGAVNLINDIDLSKTAVVRGDAVHLIAAAGDNGTAPALYYFNYGATIPRWEDAVNDLLPAGVNHHYIAAAAGSTFSAVKFSPSFDQDFIAYVVSNNATTFDIFLHVLSFNSQMWNSGIPGFPLYGDGGTQLNVNAAGVTQAPGAAITKAQIVFDPTYLGLDESLRRAYVSCSIGNGVGGAAILDFVRITDNALPVVATWFGPGIWSIGLNSDGTTLVASAAASSTVWTVQAPATPNTLLITFVPNRTIKRSGGGNVVGVSTGTDNMTIAYSGANVLLARGSTSGAFSLSTDNGNTFNDISLVRATIVNIVDQVVSPDGTKRYVISNDNFPGSGGGNTSVFYWDGTYWSRTLTLGNGNGYGYIAKASPTNFSVLYLGQVNTATLFYTSTAGQVNWLQRTSPTPTSTLVDLEVQDDATLYVATTIGVLGYVTKVSNSGQTWPTGPPYYNNVPAAGNIASLTLVGTDKVIAGGTAGQVAYTSTGGTAWIPLTAVNGGAGSAFATATDLVAGSVVYATTTTSPSIWAWTLGTSTSWGTPIRTNVAVSNDLEIYNGALYSITSGTNGFAGTQNDTTIARALLPAFGPVWASTNVSAQWTIVTLRDTPNPSVPGIANGNVGPDVLKFSTGNKIWFTDSDGVAGLDQIITYTDTLASITPTLVTPVNATVIPVNKETGVAYQTTLSFSPASFAVSYQLAIARDSLFTNPVAGFPVVVFGPAPPATVSTLVIGPPAFNYQPGETYYWRVRALTPYFSAWSSTFTFSVMPIPSPVPELYQPDNSSVVNTLKPGFSWSPMSVSDNYRFELGTDPGFIAGSMIYTVDTTSTGVMLTTALTNGTQYFWRVKVLTSVNDGWSTVANFRVEIPTAAPPPVTVNQNPVPTINLTQSADQVVNPSYIWAIIIIGAVLVIAVIVLIVRTRRS